jgi:hypothetical protein
MQHEGPTSSAEDAWDDFTGYLPLTDALPMLDCANLMLIANGWTRGVIYLNPTYIYLLRLTLLYRGDTPVKDIEWVSCEPRISHDLYLEILRDHANLRGKHMGNRMVMVEWKYFLHPHERHQLYLAFAPIPMLAPLDTAFLDGLFPQLAAPTDTPPHVEMSPHTSAPS